MLLLMIIVAMVSKKVGKKSDSVGLCSDALRALGESQNRILIAIEKRIKSIRVRMKTTVPMT